MAKESVTDMSTTTTDFVPTDLDASRWENLQPLYQALQDRQVQATAAAHTMTTLTRA